LTIWFRLPISFAPAYRYKADAKVVKTDRKMRRSGRRRLPDGTVARDFSTMSWILGEGLNQSYSAAVQQRNSDIQTPDSACAIG
jgi:hypothetical protein